MIQSNYLRKQSQIEFNKRYKNKLGKLKIKFSHGNKIHRRTALLLINKTLPKTRGKKILEVGGGVTNLLSCFPTARVVGFDTSEQAVREMKLEAQRKNLNGIFTQKFEEVETESPFDLIILSHVLEHTKDPVRFLKKYLTLLKPLGFFVILAPINEPRTAYHKKHQTGYYFKLHHQHFTEESLKKTLEKAGLVTTHQIKNNSAQYFLDKLVQFSFLRKIVNLGFSLFPFSLHLWIDKLFSDEKQRQLGVIGQLKSS